MLNGLYTVLTILGISTLCNAYDINYQGNLYVYDNDVSALDGYCSSADVDAVILPILDLSGYDGSLSKVAFEATRCQDSHSLDNGFWTCNNAKNAIKKCQQNGKHVLGSLRGLKGFHDEGNAKDFAKDVWNMFGNGVSENKPFGDAVLDGFVINVDTEVDNGKTNWEPFVKELQGSFDNKKTYDTGLMTQCNKPSGPTTNLMKNSKWNIAFVGPQGDQCGSNPQVNTWLPSLGKTRFVIGIQDGYDRTTGQRTSLAQSVKPQYCNYAGVVIFRQPGYNNIGSIKQQLGGGSYGCPENHRAVDPVPTTSQCSATSTVTLPPKTITKVMTSFITFRSTITVTPSPKPQN